MTYYEYNTSTKVIEPVGIIFEQVYSNTMNNNRLLTIPQNHIPTKGQHNDCNINSKTFKPNGSYHPQKEHYNCGASLYENSKDIEVLDNMIYTLKTAKVYAYHKSGKKNHQVADINYTKYNGRFYKYKDKPTSEINKIPLLYVLFHTKANSEPHLHMHTYIDSNGDNLDNLVQLSRIKNIEYFKPFEKGFDDIDDINQFNLLGGSNKGEEIFGSQDYFTFSDSLQDTIQIQDYDVPINPKKNKKQKDNKYIYSIGPQIATEQNPPKNWLKIKPPLKSI